MAREHDLATDLALGIVGAFVGVFVADFLGVGFIDLGFGGFWSSLLISTIGAIVLIFLVGMIRSGRTLRRQPAPDE